MRGLTPSGPGEGGGTQPGAPREQQGAVDQLELLFYEAQLELYDTKFEILKNEEQLLMAQVDTIRRQIRGRAPSGLGFLRPPSGSSGLHQG